MQDLSPGGVMILKLQRDQNYLRHLPQMFFSQLIDEPTHIKTNSTSCIDLIFTDKPALSVDSGVHSALHPNCHHQIICSTFNLNICYPKNILYKKYIQNGRFEVTSFVSKT